MSHPTNPEAVKVKRDGPRGWRWVAVFDPTVHTMFDEEKPAPRGRKPKGAE